MASRCCRRFANVQQELAETGEICPSAYSTVTARPRAVAAMARWAQDGTPALAQPKNYFPREQKNNLFARGYIASRSGHSSRNNGGPSQSRKLQWRTPASNDAIACCLRRPGGTTRKCADRIDMGTSFDCFDVRSWTDNSEISDEQTALAGLFSRPHEQTTASSNYRERMVALFVSRPVRNLRVRFPAIPKR